MARIAIDCDGVLARFERAFLVMANTIWPGKVNPDYLPTGWDDFDGLTKAEMKQVWEKIKTTPNFWTTLDAYADNVGLLSSFMSTTKGHEVFIVTSRKATAGMPISRQTDYWLSAVGIARGLNYIGIIPSENPDKKCDVYAAAGIEWSIDDKGDTVLQCEQIPNHRAYLLDRNWNREFKVKRRITDMATYFNDIRAEAGDPK